MQGLLGVLAQALVAEAKKYGIEPRTEVADNPPRLVITIGPADIERVMMESVPQQYRNAVRVKADGSITIEVNLGALALQAQQR